MCDRRKIKIAVSSLTSCALTWWENLCVSDKPQTWKDMKVLMREKFYELDLEEHIPIVSSSMPNILQDNAQNKDDYTEENEVLIMSHEVLELPLILCQQLLQMRAKKRSCAPQLLLP
jgi:hypothetical protein